MKVPDFLDLDALSPFLSSLDLDEGPLNLLFCVHMDAKGPFSWLKVP